MSRVFQIPESTNILLVWRRDLEGYNFLEFGNHDDWISKQPDSFSIAISGDGQIIVFGEGNWHHAYLNIMHLHPSHN